MQSLCIDWPKLSALVCTANAMWALSLIPTMPKQLQGIMAGGAIVAASLSCKETHKAYHAHRWGSAHRLLDEQLQQNEMAYAADAMDQLLAQRYQATSAPPEPSYNPSYSDNTELHTRNSLEAIYQGSPDDSATPSYELPTPEYCRSIAALTQTHGEAHVIKEVLKMGGREYQAGKQKLAWLIATGEQMGWT